MFDVMSSDSDQMLFRVRVTKMTGGERLPLVVDHRGLPVPGPNQWSLFIRRPQVQQNTLIEELRTLAHVYDWATRRGLDLDERLASGNGLSPAELTALYQNLRYVRPFGRKAAARRLTDVADVQVVSGKTHAARVGWAREYLIWGLERALYRLDVGDLRVREIRERCERVRRAAIDFQRPASDGAAKRIGLDRDKRSRLLEIINPQYPHNPFQRTVRFRNWVLIVLLLTFGFRRGEGLKIYVSDANVKGRNPSLTICRRPGDIHDTRANEPAVKTLGRKVPLSTEMAQMLNTFIMHHRPQFPGADMSPFLFFSTAGNPLGLRSVNAILERIVQRFPEFSGILTPHVLRYTYNDMLTESAAIAGIDAETFKVTRNYLNGWSLHSDQGDLYARRAIEERAGEMSLAHQRSLFS
jgi:hypothetical protein